MRGIYEAWKLPGSPLVEEPISAREVKAIGACILVAGSVRKFQVSHRDNWGNERFPWVLKECVAVGTTHPSEALEEIDQFASMREALREARKLVRESAIK